MMVVHTDLLSLEYCVFALQRLFHAHPPHDFLVSTSTTTGVSGSPVTSLTASDMQRMSQSVASIEWPSSTSRMISLWTIPTRSGSPGHSFLVFHRRAMVSFKASAADPWTGWLVA